MQNNSDKKELELDGALFFENWETLNQVTDEQSGVGNISDLDFSLDNLMTQPGEDYWLEQFRKMNLFGMDLIALKRIHHYSHDFKMEQSQRHEYIDSFLKHLPAKYFNELRVAGLNEDQMNLLFQGIMPTNWTIHLKYPLEYGGALSEDNLVFIPQYPFHEEIHRFLNLQRITDAGVINPETLYVPTPTSAVYVPYGTDEMTQKVIHFDPVGG